MATPAQLDPALINADGPNPGDVIVTSNLWKTYEMGDQQVNALRGVNLRIDHNEYVAIMGPSGSGKSTLMNLIGCLDSPSQGKYWLNGHDVSALNDDELARIRNKEIGFVFQTSTCSRAPPRCTTSSCLSSTTEPPPPNASPVPPPSSNPSTSARA